MRIILRHVLRNIVEKKLRTSIILLTIVLSTMVLFIGLSLNTIINDTYLSLKKGAYGDANIVVTKSTSNGNPFYQSSELNTDNLNVDERLDMVQANGKTTMNDKKFTVSLTGVDFEKAKKLGIISPIQTVDDFEWHEDMVIISERTASSQNLQLGDTIDVIKGENTYHFKIGAISQSQGIYYSEMGNILLVASHEKVNQLNGLSNFSTSTIVKVPDDAIDTAITTIKQQNEQFIVKETGAANTILRDEQTFQTVMLMAIIIIVLISAYVITSLSKLIINERMPVLATFRSIGASKRKMNAMLFLEFFMYGLIGSVIGILFATVLLPFAADVFNEYKEYGVETVVQYNPLFLIISILFGMLFPAIISFLRILRANGKPLKETLLSTSHTLEKRSIWKSMIGFMLLVGSFALYFINQYDTMLLSTISVLLLFVSIVLLMPFLLNGLSQVLLHLFGKGAKGEFFLGIKNIANNKIVANNVSMILVVFLLLLMIGIASNGIERFVTDVLKKDFDVSVSLKDGNSAMADEISHMDGVQDTYKQTIGLGTSEIKGIQNTFALYGVKDFSTIDAFYDGITYIDFDEKGLATNPNGIVIDEYVADKYDIAIGDTIKIQPVDVNYQPLEQTGPIEMTVLGTMDGSGFSSSRDAALIPWATFDKNFATIFQELHIKVDEGQTAEEMKEAINDKYSNQSLEVVTFDEMLGSQIDSVDTLIQGIAVIIGLGMIVGILGISNNLIVSFNQRKKEYAVLYSVCMSKGQIMKMVIAEMVVTFIAVVIFGLIGGIGLNTLLTKLMFAIGMHAEYSFTYGLFLSLCLVVVILLGLSTMTLVRKVFKLNIMKELRYE